MWRGNAGGDGRRDIGDAVIDFARRGRVLAEAAAVTRATRAVGAALVAVVLTIAAAVFVDGRLPRICLLYTSRCV